MLTYEGMVSAETEIPGEYFSGKRWGNADRKLGLNCYENIVILSIIM
jgi:hypothetical protein